MNCTQKVVTTRGYVDCGQCPTCVRKRRVDNKTFYKTTQERDEGRPVRVACEDPQTAIVYGQRRLVPCGKCKLCRRNWLNDFAARAYAESLQADHTEILTLTYSDDHGMKALILDYSDIQRLLKRLRKKYNVRYLVAGEYGSKRTKRAHWHIMLFFTGKVPKDLPEYLTEKKHWPEWPYGFTYRMDNHYLACRYVVKYALKAENDPRQKLVGQSRKPALGVPYLVEMQKERVAKGHAFTAEYTLPGALMRDGTPVKFWLKGAAARDAWAAYAREWYKKKRTKPPIRETEKKSWEKFIVPGVVRAAWTQGDFNPDYSLDRSGKRRMRHFDVFTFIGQKYIVKMRNSGQWLEVTPMDNEKGFRIWPVDTKAELKSVMWLNPKGRRLRTGVPF